MQSPLFPTTEASVLAPSRDSSLNVASNASSSAAGRKRKARDVEGNSQSQAFTAKPLSPKSQTHAFAPVTILARACLPLAWLNTSSSPHGPNSISGLVFEATIPGVHDWEQRVLIARKAPNGSLYAIERVEENVYISCGLHNWVIEEWCRDAAIGKVTNIELDVLLANKAGADSQVHGRTASASSFGPLPTPKSPKIPSNRRGALARMSILNSKGPESLPPTPMMSPRDFLPQQVITNDLCSEPMPLTPEAQLEHQEPTETLASSNEVLPPVEDVASMTAPVDENPIAAERLRRQYFEHLYTSKTSLAFYVKGPLSRARAHVRAAEMPSESITELMQFYEETILPAKRTDLKYKESLSRVIRELPAGEDPDLQKRKSRKKKMKLGKDCLWPDEHEYVSRWWHGRDTKPQASTNADEERKELADLRMRETKMQMLLILEVMLLETASSRLTEKPVAADPEIKVESVEDDMGARLAATPQRPSKRKRDFAREIESIVDRICIWHTVSLDIVGAEEREQNSSTSAKPRDSLRDFCKDVLLPFYSAKLPEQVKSISRKLGGPDIISPKRSKQPRPPMATSKSSTSVATVKAKPGQPLAKRTLERVLSEDQLHRHVSPPAVLSRSATTPINPIAPTLKREPSERPVSRGGMLSKSHSFSNREIDLTADSKAHEAKRRKLDKLAQQKRDLDAAIDALKRPSRSAVAREFMDEVEKRQHDKSVQISATPRSKRVKEAPFEPELPPMPRSVFQGADVMAIPSSTRKTHSRPPGVPGSSSSLPRSSATKRAVLSAIHETPSRGLAKRTSNPLELPRAVREAAVDEPADVVAATPAPKNTASIDPPDGLSSDLNFPSSQPQYHTPRNVTDSAGARMSRSRRPVLFTPLKKSDVRLDRAFRDAPEIPEQAGRMMDRVMGGKGRGLFTGLEDDKIDDLMKPRTARDTQRKAPPIDEMDEGENIYDRLGWNDDFDL